MGCINLLESAFGFFSIVRILVWVPASDITGVLLLALHAYASTTAF